MSDFAPTDRLLAVRLVGDTGRALGPEMQQELDVALYDLSEENRFRLGGQTGPYRLGIRLAERRLVLEIADADGTTVAAEELSLAPLRGLLKDYVAICDSYFDAVRRLPPAEIEAIDDGRRSLHDEGARLLRDRLAGRVETDLATARRLFTLIVALQSRG